MFKVILSLVSILVLANASDSERVEKLYDSAMDKLDCEFEDCSKPEPKVIIKEKIVYKDRPVEVEKVVLKEKIVERVVYKDRPTKEIVISKAEPKITGRKYGKLFLNVSVTNDDNFVNDYVSISRRTGNFDWSALKAALSSAPGGKTHLIISGMIELPEGIVAQDIIIKPVGTRTTGLKVAGVTWNSTELNMPNAYKETKNIPFSCKLWWWNPGDAVNWLNSNLSSLSFVISNKPTQRGEKKNFVATKIFIQED